VGADIYYEERFMKTLLGMVGIMATLAGCASTDAQQNTQVQEEKEYVTGSNIPRRNRDGVSTVSKEQVDQMIRSMPPSRPPSNGSP
jgi:hypothetical protein